MISSVEVLVSPAEMGGGYGGGDGDGGGGADGGGGVGGGGGGVVGVGGRDAVALGEVATGAAVEGEDGTLATTQPSPNPTPHPTPNPHLVSLP